MAIKIKLKNSVTQDAVPTGTHLPEVGELAVNANINSIGGYMRASDNSIVKIFGPGSVSTPAASTTVSGIAELATSAETTTGTDTARVCTPAGVKAVTDAERITSNSTYLALTGGTLTNPLVLPNASSSSPALTGADTDSGVYFATNSVSLAAGGIQGLTLNASAYVNVPTRLGVGGSPNALFDITTPAGQTDLDCLTIANASTGMFKITCSDTDAGNPTWGIKTYASEPLTYSQGGSEKFRVDSSGRLLVASSSGRTIWGASPKIQLESTDSNTSFSLIRNQSNNGGPWIALCKSRGASNGSHTIVQDGDSLGSINWFGADGVDLASTSAEIRAEIDGTPGENDLPGKLVFKTTADGASSPTTRLTIGSDGNSVFTGTATFAGGTCNGSFTVSSTEPRIYLTDTNNNSDFEIRNVDGNFRIFDSTNTLNCLAIDSSGDTTFGGNVTAANTLSVLNTSNLGDAFLKIKAGESGASVLEFESDEGDDYADLWRIQNAGDSKLGFRTKASGSWVEKLGITIDGHVGIGVTPSAWPTNADSIALQIGSGFVAYGRGSGDQDRGAIAVNYYNDGSSEKYIANGHANRIYMADGNIDFQYAASGSAGNNLTFTSGIRMLADGKVGIGTTSPGSLLELNAANDTAKLTFLRTGTTIGGTINVRDESGSKGLTYTAQDGNSAVPEHVFLTNDGSAITEKFRIQSNGNINATGAADLRLTLGSQGTAGTNDANWIRADTTHLMYNSASGDHKWEVGGSEKFRITSSGFIGAGTSSPNHMLQLHRSDSNNSYTQYTNSTTGSAAGDGVWLGMGGDEVCYLWQNENESLVLGTNNSERLRITAAGAIQSKDSVSGGGNASSGFLIGAPDTACYLAVQGKSAANGGAAGNAVFQGWFGSSNTFRVNSDGLIKTSKGIQFTGQTASSATGATTSDETLDHYEEGTWTPIVRFGGSDSGVTYGSNNGGSYTKIGRFVHVHGRIELSNKGSQTGSATIAGLPFTCSGVQSGASSVEGGAFFGYQHNVMSDLDYHTPNGQIQATTTVVAMQYRNNSGDITDITNSSFENSTSLAFEVFYPST